MVLTDPFQNKSTSNFMASQDPGGGWVVGKVETEQWCCKHAKSSSSFQEDLERWRDLSVIRGWFWSTSLELKPGRKKIPPGKQECVQRKEMNGTCINCA